jgi:hypothetical protein
MGKRVAVMLVHHYTSVYVKHQVIVRENTTVKQCKKNKNFPA